MFIALSAINTDLYAAEAGMPQLDPTYWASQGFWLILIFTILYISISKFYLPKIKDNLDNRENKIKEDLENANKFKEQSEAKLKEYEFILENAKKEVSKIHFESKNILDKEIQSKKDMIEKDIEKELASSAKYDSKSGWWPQILELQNNQHTLLSLLGENLGIAEQLSDLKAKYLRNNLKFCLLY